MTLSEDMKKIAQDDIEEIIGWLEDDGYKANLVSMELDPDEIEMELIQNVKAVFNVNGKQIPLDFYYSIKTEAKDIYINKPDDELANELKKASRNVSESTRVKSKPVTAAKITAADEDFESDEFDESFDDAPEDKDEDSLADSIDSISDKVDDMQDTIDDAEVEDDIDIDIENNIDNHYIAECERCHGIFISSVVESDQQLEKIHGTCPLCDRDTDQYLKWTVKKVEK